MPTYVEIPLPEGSTFTCTKENALYYRISPEIKSDNKCGLLPTGVYKAVATCENDGYLWAKFFIPSSAIERYAAVYDGISYLSEPVDYRALYEEELAKNAALEKALDAAKAENAELLHAISEDNEKLAEISASIKTLLKYGG